MPTRKAFILASSNPTAILDEIVVLRGNIIPEI